MNANRNIAIISCGILAACTSMDQGMKLAVKPVSTVSTAATPSDYYRLGRYYQGQMRLDDAEHAYREALLDDPSFADAENGLGVIYSMEGKYRDAIAMFHSATRHDPRSAQIYNNLGYAYYLHGNYSDAVSALKKAHELDQSDAKILDNLGLAYAKAKDSEKSMLAFSAASKIESALPKIPTAEESLAIPKDRGVVARAPEIPVSQEPLVKLSNNVYELKEEKQAPVPYRVEVSNGNGINGMAKRMGHALLKEGYPVTRYTNQKPFVERATSIQYRYGMAGQARNLGESLPVKVALVENNRMRRDIGVRLVLGRDMVKREKRFAASVDAKFKSAVVAFSKQ